MSAQTYQLETFVILQQMAVIACLVLIGYGTYKKNIIDNRFCRQLSVLIVDFTNPALMISAVISGDITASRRDVLTALLIAAVVYALLCVLGAVMPRFLGVHQEDRRFYHLMTVYTNTGFIGIPLATAILPENAMIYVIIFNIMFSIYMYTHGVLVLGGEGINLKKVISPGTVAAIVALLIYWFRVPVPDMPASFVQYLGNATTFLTMIMLGASIAQQSIIKCFQDKIVWNYIIYRMLALPATMTIVLKHMKLNPDMILAYCLMLSLPAANMPLILAEKEGYPTATLSKVILTTTLVSFFTITFLLSVLF